MNTRSLLLAALGLCLVGSLGLHPRDEQESLGDIQTAQVFRGGRSPYQADQPNPSKPPKVYTIPLRGQLGTDITPSIYRQVIEDAKAKQPDLIVLILESADYDQVEFTGGAVDDPEEAGRFDQYELRDLVNSIKEDLRHIPQVVWVKDAAGPAAVLAFAWPDFFMGEHGRIEGLMFAYLNTRHPDWEVHRKFLAAWVGIVVGFLEAGGYDKVLGEAMIVPSKKLSVSWQGRKLIWRSDEEGTYVVDNDPKGVPAFTAKVAEDLLLSKGTASDLDDLMFMLGYREWDRSLVDGKQDGERIVSDYVKRWRDAFKKSNEAYQTYRREIGWATGGAEGLAHLGKARRALQEVLDAMNRFPAVEFRWRQRGLTRDAVERRLLELREAITAAERGRRGGTTGGGGGMGGGGSGRGLGR